MEIRRFQLGNYTGSQYLTMPLTAVVVRVGMIGDSPYVWVIGDFGFFSEARRFIITTENTQIFEAELAKKYIGMIVMWGVDYHVLELT